MSNLLEMGLTNAAIASTIALVVVAVGRLWRNPLLIHALWVLVLIKLLTPPMVAVHWHPDEAVNMLRTADAKSRASQVMATKFESPTIEPPEFASHLSPFIPPQPAPDTAAAGPARIAAADPPSEFPSNRLPGDERRLPVAETTIAAALWLGGSVVILLTATGRLLRFHRALASAAPAPEQLCEMASGVAKALGYSGQYQLRVTEGRLSPLVWPIGRPTIVLPRRLLQELSPDETQTLLAHEFAHLRRKDHWVRWLELAAIVAYWWLPVTWWARNAIRRTEEQACDAWVVEAFPNSVKRYAVALLNAVEFVSTNRAPAPLVASRLDAGRNLKERIENVMNGRLRCRLSMPLRLAVIALAVPILPLNFRSVWAADEKPEAAIRQSADAEQADATDARQHAADERHDPYPSESNKVKSQTRQLSLPAEPYKIAPGDLLRVAAAGVEAEHPLDGEFIVEPGGTVALGPRYGRVNVAGQTLEDAEKQVLDSLLREFKNPMVQITAAGWPKARKASPSGATYPSDNNRRELSSYQTASETAGGAEGVSPEEIKLLRDHVGFLQAQFELMETRFQVGKVVQADRDTAGYEMATAQAELAQAEGRIKKAAEHLADAEKYAEQALKSTTSAYEAGNVMHDQVRKAGVRLSQSKLRLLRMRTFPLATTVQKQQSSVFSDRPPRDLAPVTAQAPSDTSIGVWKRIVESRKQQYERMRALAERNAVSAAELERAKDDYEINAARMKQAERALRSMELQVQLAETEYQQALEASKAAPNSVSELELQKLRIKLEIAKAKLAELAE